MKRIGIIAFLSILTYCSLCFAAGFPYTLNYQGMLLTNAGQPVNVSHDITFSLYTTPSGTGLPFWTESQTQVQITNGQFSVTLGAGTPLDPSKFGGETYLGVKVGTQAEMSPRQKMTSVPYAFNGIPKGGIIMWSGTTVPVGWALCDGSNGTPDLRDRFVVGFGNRFGTGKVRNVIGGEEDHTLTVSEMPVHSHGVNDPGHNHTYTGFERMANDNGNGPDVQYGTPAASTSGNVTGISIQNAGTGAAHNNLPPYYALAFIMKL